MTIEMIRRIGQIERPIERLDRPEIPDTNIELDFTDTAYDTKAECNARGLRFSDAASPFPTSLRFPIGGGTWSHSTGNGWQPAAATDEQGPGILLPAVRGGNWELRVGVNYSPAGVTDKGAIQVGYLTTTNHVGAYGQIEDNDAANSEMLWKLITNDGDETYTAQYTGSTLAATGQQEIRFRCIYGCVGVYDDEDDAWNYYEGRQTSSVAYTAAYPFIGFYKFASATFWTIYVESLKLLYLT
jgi:hypothetical protein